MHVRAVPEILSQCVITCARTGGNAITNRNNIVTGFLSCRLVVLEVEKNNRHTNIKNYRPCGGGFRNLQ